MAALFFLGKTWDYEKIVVYLHSNFSFMNFTEVENDDNRKKKMIKYLMIMRRFWMICLLLIGMTLSGYAQQRVALGEKPDFDKCFDILRKNREIYNQYNDSIFRIKEHDKWVNYFRHRALKNLQIFQANREIINAITDYFDKDPERKDTAACSELYHAFGRNYFSKSASDPFVAKKIYHILEEYDKVLPAEKRRFFFINRLKSWVNRSVWDMVKDTTYLRNAYRSNLLLTSGSLKDKPLDINSLLGAYVDLSNTIFLRNGLQSLLEYRNALDTLRAILSYPPILERAHPRTVQLCKNRLLTADENLLRNVYLADTTVLEKEVADSMMRRMVDRNLKNPKLTDLSYIRTLVMQMHLHQLTAREALKLGLKRYRASFERVRNKRLEVVEFRNFLQPFFTLFYFNDLADISYARRRRNVLKMCRDIEHVFQYRKDKQNDNSYISNMNALVLYDRITKYLKPKERVHFLNSLCVATQVTTYAHSAHVAKIAETLMRGILQYQPAMLKGLLGCKSESDVKRHKKKFMDYIHGAALYHDIGKNSIISVVNNDYRPLTADERKIITLHPELGLKFLELSPELEKFHDTTLGHHKWYNGKGGYPASFDNTQSPVRLMIDIVTLSDCLQAATERIGRNYKGDKNFDTVMKEFRAEAGTRYNPDLVAFIDAHPDVADELSNLIEDGWVEIYYNIYKQFISEI